MSKKALSLRGTKKSYPASNLIHYYMKNSILSMIAVLASILTANAQTNNKTLTEHDPAIQAKDAQVKSQIIDPAQQVAGEEAPDWAALTKTITAKFDATTADRTITKAKIYFYYNKDWPQFCAGIVNYTNHYELADDYHVLNLNAGMILKNSDDPKQFKEALRWAKAAADSDPANAPYKETYESLKAKVTP
jgi:hypothetical protein